MCVFYFFFYFIIFLPSNVGIISEGRSKSGEVAPGAFGGEREISLPPTGSCRPTSWDYSTAAGYPITISPSDDATRVHPTRYAIAVQPSDATRVHAANVYSTVSVRPSSFADPIASRLL